MDGFEGQAELKALLAIHGKLPPTLAVRTGRPGGCHIYFAANGLLVPSKIDKEKHIDVRGTTGYVVAPPSNHISGQGYCWIDPAVPLAPTPEWVAGWVSGGSKAGRKLDGSTSKAARKQAATNSDNSRLIPTIADELGPLPDHLQNQTAPGVTASLTHAAMTPWSSHEEMRLRSALAAIRADLDGRTWASYGRALYELHWVVEGVDRGFELWDEWSSKSKNKGIGVGEYKGRKNLLEKRWKVFAETEHNFTGLRVTVASIYAKAREAHAPQSENFKIFRGDELLATPALPRRWLVERFVPAAEVTMLGGDGGAGKTTLALQLSIAGITGSDWFGLKVNPSNVLYVSAEDPKDEIHYRLEQITKHLKINKDELERLKLIDLAGKDSTMATFEKNGAD